MNQPPSACQVIFYEAFDEEATVLKRLIPAGLTAGFTWQTVQESGHRDPPAPIVSIRTQSELPAAWGRQVDAVLSRSAGYDHLTAWRRRCGADVPMGYLPDYCARAVAEQAVLSILALFRKLPRQMNQFSSFDRDGLTGRECTGKTLAVVGVGRIGYAAAGIARALGMDVIGVDIDPRHADMIYVARRVALARADAVLCAMNRTAENTDYFNADTFRRMDRRPVFVNIARGELVRLDALLDALEQGRLSGAALDVYPDEGALGPALRAGRSPDHPLAGVIHQLLARDDVILTPHNAFNTHEAVARKSEQSIRQIAHFLAHRAFLWPVPAD